MHTRKHGRNTVSHMSSMTNLCTRPNLEHRLRGCLWGSGRLRLLLWMSAWDCSQHIVPGSAVLIFLVHPSGLRMPSAKTRIARLSIPHH